MNDDYDLVNRLKSLPNFLIYLDEIRIDENNDYRIIYRFNNHYGVSILRENYEDYLKLRILKFFEEDEWWVDTNNSVSNEVIDHVKKDDLIRLLTNVKSLNEKGELP